jgi:hypothetical protein
MRTQSNLLKVLRNRHGLLHTPSPTMAAKFHSGLDSTQKTRPESQSDRFSCILSQHLLGLSALVSVVEQMENPNLVI